METKALERPMQEERKVRIWNLLEQMQESREEAARLAIYPKIFGGDMDQSKKLCIAAAEHAYSIAKEIDPDRKLSNQHLAQDMLFIGIPAADAIWIIKRIYGLRRAV